jgi:undecaprenyl-diphosphatase
MTTFQAIIIAIVEGITEFLPVSSTGHMIITQEMLGMEITEFVKAFTVNIQFGAILSVIVLYWKRFFQSFDFYLKLFVAFIPAAIIGFLLSDFIDSMLESVLVVAIMLVLGGVLLIFVDNWFKNPSKDQKISYPSAFKIGLYQCIAMIPGVSRSAASIIGGMTQKLDRKTAAEFSFFLAVPTMFAASAYKLLQNYKSISTDDIDILIIGNAVAFVVAMIAIKSFITFLTRYGFKYFGYYRIVVGLAILVMLAMGIDLDVT